MTEKQTAQKLIGRAIRLLREQQGLTLEELASRSRISYQYLSGIETGKENFTISVLESIASVLEVPLKNLVSLAYLEAEDIVAPKVNPAYFRPEVPLPEGLAIAHLEAAMNQAQAIIYQINRHLLIEIGKPLHAYLQGNNFSGLVSNLLSDALNDHSPYKHYHGQRYPDLINRTANNGLGEGLEVKATIKKGKGGESHNGHSGWHTVACYEFDAQGNTQFIHIMFAKLNGHQASEPDWKYVKSKVNEETGSQRTETYSTNGFGNTKLRDGSVYLNPDKINPRNWYRYQARRDSETVPPWSIFA